MRQQPFSAENTPNGKRRTIIPQTNVQTVLSRPNPSQPYGFHASIPDAPDTCPCPTPASRFCCKEQRPWARNYFPNGQTGTLSRFRQDQGTAMKNVSCCCPVETCSAFCLNQEHDGSSFNRARNVMEGSCHVKNEPCHAGAGGNDHDTPPFDELSVSGHKHDAPGRSS